MALTAAILGVLLGLCLPGVCTLLSAAGRAAAHLYTYGTPPTPRAPQSASARIVGAPQLHMYLAAWSVFHLLEFLVTAYWNAPHLRSDSFLLQNGAMYAAAHIFGLLEFALEMALFAPLKCSVLAQVAGLCFVAVGQVLRSFAMVHASTNFSHAMAEKKRESHMLVKTGVYAYVRHPSYVGFFYWALGTQILLCNPIGFILFALALRAFFADRIRREEQLLHQFFGASYAQYASTVPAGVPFVT
ncbi:protein-S-isoprenylcysteine O-methyltransferase [Malassezia vespertilionis]|nr:protein-S-isoprenylcysteine O-methyltransferase [Malassezia vespertilionis]WFD05446.1 protein-S-isoprenylcysteine O-methyltransferase [Malassezia vespertilionis]